MAQLARVWTTRRRNAHASALVALAFAGIPAMAAAAKPRLVLSFTNEASGASATLQVSGPGHDIFHADGTISTRYTGRGVPLFEGVFLLSVGRHDYEVSGSWDLLEQGSASGQSHEICDLIS
jgi:hypothetical protein